jgi:hypothetical protein
MTVGFESQAKQKTIAAENRKVGGSIPSLPITVQAKSGLSALITGAIKWGDADFAFLQLRRLRAHTLWPPP